MRLPECSRSVLALASLVLIGATEPVSFETSVLSAHNEERARLALPPLRWSGELAEGAKEWSDYLARTGRFEHSPNRPGQPRLGENIWGGTAGKFGPQRMVAAWIAEGRYFKPGTFPANSTTAKVEDVTHYTQVIWRGTGEVGCAVSRGTSEDILVCRYNSPGNVIGHSPI